MKPTYPLYVKVGDIIAHKENPGDETFILYEITSKNHYLGWQVWGISLGVFEIKKTKLNCLASFPPKVEEINFKEDTLIFKLTPRERNQIK